MRGALPSPWASNLAETAATAVLSPPDPMGPPRTFVALLVGLSALQCRGFNLQGTNCLGSGTRGSWKFIILGDVPQTPTALLVRLQSLQQMKLFAHCGCQQSWRYPCSYFLGLHSTYVQVCRDRSCEALLMFRMAVGRCQWLDVCTRQC